uniref:Structural maintenance of chromosomes protein 5 n=1 Tax=Scophthalmus maximus TaxID=52904 RepID=A0A8D3CCE0_SCOMX
MAEPRKRQRLSQVNSSSQTSTSSVSSVAGGQRDGAGEESRFVEGSILRLSMKNFLTYDYSVVYPGPNLNMIVGANGTGKSSIVCAICLGLAGKTAILGRGDKVGLYVKRGCHKGFIEIELYKRGGNVVINREIHVENNQSLWMLNGRHCNQKTVEEEVKALHIQVSNLLMAVKIICEKVGEFAKMSKIELLEATEKSVGPPQMYQYHCELKNFRNKERELENAVKEKASFLEKAKQRNERNKHDVNRYYEKKRHLDVIELLDKKKPWVEYETIRKELEDLKRERDEAKKQLSALRQAQSPMLKKIQQIDNHLKPTDAQIKAKTVAIKEASNKCKQKQDQLDRKHKEIEDIKQKLKLKQTEEEDHQKRIGNTRRAIDDLKAELAKVGDQPDVTPQINAINVELRQIQEDRAKIEGEKGDLRREKDNLCAEARSEKLNDMNNMMNVKEEKLRARHRDTHAALQWLRQNRKMFDGNVFEPMMLVINVKDHRFAKYVENHIPFQDLRAFVFQRKDDMEKFMTEVRDRMNLKVNSISAPEESYSKRRPSRNIESLSRFGFFTYLREMFDAPEEVMSYLCLQYKVHDIPVGNEQTKSMIKTVIEEPYLRVLYTSEEKYIVKRSHYSNKISTSNSALQRSQYLTITVDAEQKRLYVNTRCDQACEQKLRDIDERLKVLQKEAVTLERRDNELLAEKKRLSELKGKKRQLEQKISTKQDSLFCLSSSFSAFCLSSRVSLYLCSLFSRSVRRLQLRAKLTMEKVYLSLETVGLLAEKTKLENDCREGASELKTTEQKCNRLEQRKVQLTEQCKGLLRRAKSTCRMQPDESLPEDLRNAFSELPNTLDEIDAMLNEERSRAECFTGLSENVVDEYNKREQEIKHLETELEEKTNALSTYRQNISEAKERWLNPLKQLVEQINDKFSDFFRSMQCAGEVDLHTENEEEYDKYGIRIRVKFHSSTQLHELTAYHQSGGERSVSTMLYLMALQELNRCPFRVVDEINQGMDPVNERRVFDIVVRTACKETTSQYFFITPKLLQNLQYAEEMTILCVHNGAHMLPPNQWDEKTFIKRCLKRKAKA